MNKNTKIVLGVVLVLAILLVAVGYAAIQTVNLKIESSSAQATPNQSNFTVKFTGTPTTGGVGTTTATIDENDELKASMNVTGLTAKGVVSTIGLGTLAVGTGATLGKIVGDALYNANPEIWSSPSVPALSKTDFNKFVTTIKDDVGTVLHDGVLALWGVDGDTTTMYLDENDHFAVV